jgi:hypothetical protein
MVKSSSSPLSWLISLTILVAIFVSISLPRVSAFGSFRKKAA